MASITLPSGKVLSNPGRAVEPRFEPQAMARAVTIRPDGVTHDLVAPAAAAPLGAVAGLEAAPVAALVPTGAADGTSWTEEDQKLARTLGFSKEVYQANQRAFAADKVELNFAAKRVTPPLPRSPGTGPTASFLARWGFARASVRLTNDRVATTATGAALLLRGHCE